MIEYMVDATVHEDVLDRQVRLAVRDYKAGIKSGKRLTAIILQPDPIQPYWRIKFREEIP